MDHLMVLLMVSLRDFPLEVNWDIQMAKQLDLMKASNLDLMMVNCLALYLEIYI